MASSKSSVRNLAEKLHSLLGLKAHLTSNWVEQVSQIIKTFPSETSNSPSLGKKGLYDTLTSDEDNDPSKIRDQLAALTYHLSQLKLERRQVLNDFLNLKGNIRVFCRIRPATFGENFGRLGPIVALDLSRVLLKPADTNKSKSYYFDRVFSPVSSQEEVFSEVEPVIKSIIDGYNACIFAYGQTGTGKTFTMEGRPGAPGLVPRAMEALFKQAGDSNRSFHISFSLLEIYKGNLRDLLVPKPTKATDPTLPCLSIQTDPKGGIEIDNLVAIHVNDFNQALRLYRMGCQFRSTASTNSNMNSSRSHCMIRLELSCFDAPERRRETNKMWLIDLGGSERVLKTKARGKRLDEGKAINLSLSALGDVIYALQRKQHHVPYRNSKLTQVLKDSLGNDSKTLMLVHISPKEEDLCETICSLNFATRVKSIHLRKDDKIEVKLQKEGAIANLQEKMERIEDECLHVRREIEKLNIFLEKLTGENSSFEKQLDFCSFPAGVFGKNTAPDVVAAPMSKLPRFMRPTICSKRKSGTTNHVLEQTDTVYTRRRRSSSLHAESVTFPVKDCSQYNTDRSISRSSCLAGLNIRNSIDNLTEYSQETTETEVTTINVREERIPPRSSNSEKGVMIQQTKKSRWAHKIDHEKLLEVDNWLHVENRKPTIHCSINAIRRTPAASAFERGIKAEKFLDNKVNAAVSITKGTRCGNFKQTADVGVERSISELANDKPRVMLRDLFDDTSDSISSLLTTDSKTVIPSQCPIDRSSIEGNEHDSISSLNVCSVMVDGYNGDGGASEMAIMQEDNKEACRSDGYPLRKCACRQCSLSSTDGQEIYSDEICTAVPRSELRSDCQQQLPAEVEKECCTMQHYDSSLQTSTTLIQIDPLWLRSQRALFMNKNQGALSMPTDKPVGNTETPGICHILAQKTETLCATALLGMGFYNLGYEHDFFFGLML